MLFQAPSKNTFMTLLIVIIVGIASQAHAELNIVLGEPAWEFILGNPPIGNNDAQLEPNERAFAQSIKPLLSEQKYQQVLEKFSQRKLEDDSAALQVLRGQILLSVKQYVPAAQAFNLALQSKPQLANAHRSLSMAYMLQKKYAQAQQHLVRTIELGYADAQVYGQLAFINLQNNAAASAIAGYQQALFLDPQNTQWQQGLLYAYLQSDALTQAQSLVEQMLQADTNNRELWLVRSQIALQQQHMHEALSSLEVALRLGESAPENRLTAAQLHLQSGSIERAVELMAQNVSQINSENQENILPAIENAMAWLAGEQQWSPLAKLLKATNRYEHKLPSRYKAHFKAFQAQLALHNGNITKAQNLLKNTLSLEPTMGDALITLADLYRGQKQFEQANNYYIRAQALNEYQEQALLGQAQMEIDRQEYREALALLRKVMQINPSRHDVASNIRTLENVVRQES